MDSTIAFFLFISSLFIAVLIPILFSRYITLSKLPWHSITTVAIGWAVAFSYVLILCPLDLSLSVALRCQAFNNAEIDRFQNNGTAVFRECVFSNQEVVQMRHALTSVYSVTFWLVTVVFGWIIMGLQSSYLYSADFTESDRLRTALRENAVYYGTGLAVVLPIALGLWYNYSADYATGFIFAISNLYSLFCITCLMSYGLVNIPRRLYNQVRWQADQDRLHFDAWVQNQHRHDAEYALEDIAGLIYFIRFELKRKLGVMARLDTMIPQRHSMRVYLDLIREVEYNILFTEIPEAYRSLPRVSIGSEDLEELPNELDLLTLKHLALVRVRVRDAVAAYKCADVHFSRLVAGYVRYDDLKAAVQSDTGVIEWSELKNETDSDDNHDSFLQRCGSSLAIDEHSRLYLYWKRVEYMWLMQGRQGLYLALFVMACLWSAFTVLAEISLITGRNPNLSILSLVFDSMSKSASPATVYVLLLMMMGYQVLATFYTLFSLKLGSFYFLYSEKQSMPDQIVNNAFYLARFAPALVQNFLHLLREETGTSTSSAFTSFFGASDLIPYLGPGVEVIFPLLLGVLILVTWFGHYIYLSYLKEAHFTLLDWVDDHVWTEERVRYGASCLEQAARRLRVPRGSGAGTLNSTVRLLSLGSASVGSSSTYLEMNEGTSGASGITSGTKSSSAPLDVQSYLQSVRERHEQQKSRSHAFSKLKDGDNSV